MSKFTTIEVVFKDKDSIIEALKALGYSTIDVGHDIEMFGYSGDISNERGDIVVRKSYLSSVSNDLGFQRQRDGTYRLVMSDYDVTYLRGGRWVTDFKKLYSYNVVKRFASSKGYTIASETKMADSTVKITLRKW